MNNFTTWLHLKNCGVSYWVNINAKKITMSIKAFSSSSFFKSATSSSNIIRRDNCKRIWIFVKCKHKQWMIKTIGSANSKLFIHSCLAILGPQTFLISIATELPDAMTALKYLDVNIQGNKQLKLTDSTWTWILSDSSKAYNKRE